MEKQLLFLLDWDLNITEQDLYTHLSPFLEPIKAEIMEAEHRARQLVNQERLDKMNREFELQQALLRQQQRTQIRPEEAQLYHGQYFDESHYYQPAPLNYHSPPSSNEVPGLARSGTADTVSTSSSSSYVEQLSRSGTPNSSIGSYMEDMAGNQWITVEQNYKNMGQATRVAPIVRDTVHIVEQHSGSGKHPIAMLPYEIEREYIDSKPAKKPRFNNMLSRFLGGKERAY